MSETSSAGCTRNCRSRPDTLVSQFSRSALPPKTQMFWLRAIATAPGIASSSPGSRSVPMVAIRKDRGWVGMNDRLGFRCSFVRACGLALLPGNPDNTHCAFVPSCLSHYFILIALTLLTREPLQRGIKLRTMWRCLHCRCGAVTATAG